MSADNSMNTDKNISIKNKCVLAIATLFGVGYTPLMPGTAACLVALLVAILIRSQAWFIIVTVLSLVLAFYFSGRAENILGKKDAKEIVIDDFSGMLITYILIPYNIKFIIVGFFLFRAFDMLKVPPANRVEKCKGALGIVGDDVVAGVYANFILHIVNVLLRASAS